jgi:hypothetical protein
MTEYTEEVQEKLQEALLNAREELKRVDHMIFISLKYTRTVDVLRNIIDRMINAFSFGVDSLLLALKEQKKIPDIPASHKEKCETILKQFPEDEQIQEYIKLYLHLRKVIRARYTKREEFRRHVTMTSYLENEEVVETTMDTLKDDNYKLIAFIHHVNELVFGRKEEE